MILKKSKYILFLSILSILSIFVFASCSFSFMTVKVKGVKTYMINHIENKSNRILSPFFEDGINMVIKRYTTWRWSANPDLQIKIIVNDFKEEPKDYTVSGQVLSYLYTLNTRVVCMTKKDTLLNKEMSVSILWREGDSENDKIEELGEKIGNKILGNIGSDW